jgi:hypothetical protein
VWVWLGMAQVCREMNQMITKYDPRWGWTSLILIVLTILLTVLYIIYIYRLYLMVTELGRVLIPRSWVQRHFVMPYDTTQQRKFFRKHTRHPRKLAW